MCRSRTFVGRFAHLQQVELALLDQRNHRGRPPALNRIEVGVQIPLPGPGYPGVIGFAGAQRDADPAVVAPRGHRGDADWIALAGLHRGHGLASLGPLPVHALYACRMGRRCGASRTVGLEIGSGSLGVCDRHRRQCEVSTDLLSVPPIGTGRVTPPRARGPPESSAAGRTCEPYRELIVDVRRTGAPDRPDRAGPARLPRR